MIPSTTSSPGSSFASPEKGRCTAGRPRFRLMLVGAALAVTGALGVSNAAPSQALTFNPGVFTSSVYLSQSETRSLADSVAPQLATKASRACRILGVSIPGAGCTVVMMAHGNRFKSAVSRAADSQGCLRIRMSGTPQQWLTMRSFPVILGWYADHNRIYCKP
ncbi:hypothetical protein SAMN06264364_1642 [Quadrisphaera granulorum]|uniref:Uncharacterized protein n=1 Tax=Quadrisphaera granulorum TaxID=317664 RepID=A0A315ZF94_9ACTN|nr:hypothetical protein [Quadrisphaera granulorum]PWJ43414.1 hypothetical protein BXY45_1642 [Quadrisphaera granulorum]SZE99213.1 hypothetical protein SAMN06264364_1642 [Quadrisphaera granulorum]